MAPGGWREVEVDGLALRVWVHPCVYPPSEDSLLAVRLLRRLRGRWGRLGLVADLGSGTGVLGLAASLVYGAWIVATDVNPWAVEATRRTIGGRGVVLRCHWASCLSQGFDLAIANPPYLPVEEACREAARIASRAIIVYSSLTGWDPGGCFERAGLRIVGRLTESYFMEELVAVAGERVG